MTGPVIEFLGEELREMGGATVREGNWPDRRCTQFA